MNFDSYADAAIDLANLEPHGAPAVAALRAWADGAFPHFRTRLTPADRAPVLDLHRRLRTALTAEDDRATVDALNGLLREHPVSPQISGHDASDWHLHLDRADLPTVERMAAILVMGLVTALLDTGVGRRGICGRPDCGDVFIDVSPGGTRRYCGTPCANRANVAAHRARRRAEAAG